MHQRAASTMVKEEVLTDVACQQHGEGRRRKTLPTETGWYPHPSPDGSPPPPFPPSCASSVPSLLRHCPSWLRTHRRRQQGSIWDALHLALVSGHALLLLTLPVVSPRSPPRSLLLADSACWLWLQAPTSRNEERGEVVEFRLWSSWGRGGRHT